jgi:hypothetical protein
MTVSDGTNQWYTSTWFLGLSKVCYIEEGWKDAYIDDSNYVPDEFLQPGIEYFMKSVWFRGILGGQKMQDLLTECSAEQIGHDMIRGKLDKIIIYRIPPNENDRQNGRGNLLVWLTLGQWHLERTRLNAVYGTELTDYRDALSDVQNSPEVYYSDYLPPDAYWSINNYLTTHESPFWQTPPEANPLQALQSGSGQPSSGSGASGSDKPADKGKSDDSGKAGKSGSK